MRSRCNWQLSHRFMWLAKRAVQWVPLTMRWAQNEPDVNNNLCLIGEEIAKRCCCICWHWNRNNLFKNIIIVRVRGTKIVKSAKHDIWHHIQNGIINNNNNKWRKIWLFLVSVNIQHNILGKSFYIYTTIHFFTKWTK